MNEQVKSILYVDAAGELKVYACVQRGALIQQPETCIFVHHGTKMSRDGYNYSIELNDQDLVIGVTDVYQYTGNIVDAVNKYLIDDEATPFNAIGCVVADDSGQPNMMTEIFNITFNVSPHYSDACPSCAMHMAQANKIIELLDGSVLIHKPTRNNNERFTQHNLKRAVFLRSVDLETLLEWLVETFHATFERAMIDSVTIVDPRSRVIRSFEVKV